MKNKKTKEVAHIMRVTTVRLPAELLKAAKQYALDQDTSLQSLMIEALQARIKASRKEVK